MSDGGEGYGEALKGVETGWGILYEEGRAQPFSLGVYPSLHIQTDEGDVVDVIGSIYLSTRWAR